MLGEFSALTLIVISIGSAHVLFRQLADWFGHGGGKQRGLSFLGSVFEDPVYVVYEAHAEHFVRFIEYECLQIVEFQVPFFDVVHDSARGADHHLSSPFEFSDLFAIAGPSIHRDDTQLREVLGIALDGFGYLQSEFPGRSKAENLGALTDSSIRESRGREKAAVLPVPVWATPSKSDPSRRGGMAFS